MNVRATWLMALMVYGVSSGSAGVPQTISQQGLLLKAGGIAPNGDYTLTFRLYAVPAGGTALWTETKTVTVTGGIYDVILGSVTPLTLPFDQRYWLGVQVDLQPEMTPRVQLTSVPYAHRAAVADALAGGGVGDITAVYAENGLTGGATSGDAHLNVGAGDGIVVTADAVAVNVSDFAGPGLGEDGAGDLKVNTGTGLEIAADAVALTDPFATGSAYDTRFVNEGQANSVTAAMVQPPIVSSVGGVTHDGGNIDLVAGDNINIVADDANNTITFSTSAGGDITAVYAHNGLTGGAASGDVHLNVGEGTGIQVSADAVSLASNYADGSAYDSRFVNEAQTGAISTNMLKDAAVTMGKLADYLNVGSKFWHWYITNGRLDIDISSSFPAAWIKSYNTDRGDCLWLRSSPAAKTGTAVLQSTTWKGTSIFANKLTDDNSYAAYILAPAKNSEGLFVKGNTVATGTKSAVVETQSGPQAIFSVESPEVEIYASGRGKLAGGNATVHFDPLFTEAVSPTVEIRVTLTPVGSWSALFLTAADPRGFQAQSEAGNSEAEFCWMACGRRKGYETRPLVSIPDQDAHDRIQQEKEARARAGEN